MHICQNIVLFDSHQKSLGSLLITAGVPAGVRAGRRRRAPREAEAEAKAAARAAVQAVCGTGPELVIVLQG